MITKAARNIGTLQSTSFSTAFNPCCPLSYFWAMHKNLQIFLNENRTIDIFEPPSFKSWNIKQLDDLLFLSILENKSFLKLWLAYSNKNAIQETRRCVGWNKKVLNHVQDGEENSFKVTYEILHFKPSLISQIISIHLQARTVNRTFSHYATIVQLFCSNIVCSLIFMLVVSL